MGIDLMEWKRLVSSTAPLTPWLARSIVTRFYCNKLVISGICTNQCRQICKASLGNIFRTFPLGSNAAALVTWRAKNEAASMCEQSRAQEHQEPVKKPVLFSEPPPKENPFEALLDSL